MNSLFTIIVIIQVLSALAIIGLVLLQHGKGADMGAAFGSGASGSLFGATGSSNFLSKSTGVAAAIFFSATLALSYFANKHSAGDIMENLPAPAVVLPADTSAKTVPATTASAPTAPAAPQTNQIPK